MVRSARRDPCFLAHDGTGRPHLPEHLILRDTLYLLQGISGKYVHLSPSTNADGNNDLVFEDDPVSDCDDVLFITSIRLQRYVISTPTKTLVHRLAEVGHLYMRVDAFVREREGQVGVGMIEQSLCHHLQTQLTEYYRLIAILESQMSVSTSTDGSQRQSAMEEGSIREEESGLTLKRLDVWIEDWRLRMRMMSVCVEGAKGSGLSSVTVCGYSQYHVGAHGGALVNLIHGYTDNGDPFVRKFTDQLLEEVSPLLHISPVCLTMISAGVKTVLRHTTQVAFLR